MTVLSPFVLFLFLLLFQRELPFGIRLLLLPASHFSLLLVLLQLHLQGLCSYAASFHLLTRVFLPPFWGIRRMPLSDVHRRAEGKLCVMFANEIVNLTVFRFRAEGDPADG